MDQRTLDLKPATFPGRGVFGSLLAILFALRPAAAPCGTTLRRFREILAAGSRAGLPKRLEERGRPAASLAGTDRCGIQALSGLYRGRRGIEGMYGTGKAVTGYPRAGSGRCVRREIHAASVLTAPARQISSRCGGEGLPATPAGFGNGLRPVGKEAGAMFLRTGQAVADSGRPGRSCGRRPKQPGSRWTGQTAA